MDRLDVARALRKLANLLELEGESAFKVRAYKVAADRIAGLNEPIERIAGEGRLREIPGIGAAIAQKIESLLATGHIPLLDRLEAAHPDAGLAEMRRRREPRPLGEARPIAEEILAHVEEDPGVHRASLTGAIRRWEELVPGIELLAATTDPRRTLDWFERYPGADGVAERGATACTIALYDGLSVTLRTTPLDGWTAALVRQTGDAEHVRRLERLAAKRQLSLAETGLFRGDGVRLDPPDEDALYADLGLPPVPPELRDDADAIDDARRGALPDLVTADAIRGMTHCHSTWSDGKHTIREMAHAARILGYEYLTITDHSHAAHYANGLDPDRLRRQWDEIAQAQEEVPEVRLLRGSEVDILADGSLDFPDALLEQLDVVVASIHRRHRLDEAGQTRRLVRALAHPLVSWIGHPTGRLVGSREPYPLRLEEVFEAAAAYGKALEVNGTPHRLDLSGALVRQALRHGVKLVISTDAHSTAGMQALRYGVATARRGRATAADVLNTLPADAFLAALRGGRGVGLQAAEGQPVD